MAADLGRVLLKGLEGQSLGGITGQFSRAMNESEGAVGIAMHPDPGLDVVAPVAVGRDLQFAPFKGDTVVFVDGPLELFAEYVVQPWSNATIGSTTIGWNSSSDGLQWGQTTQIPVVPSLRTEVWWALRELLSIKEFEKTKTFQKLKVFCTELLKDECGNTREFRTNFERTELINEIERLTGERIETREQLLRLLFVL